VIYFVICLHVYKTAYNIQNIKFQT